MTITYVCMTVGGMDADSKAKGLVVKNEFAASIFFPGEPAYRYPRTGSDDIRAKSCSAIRMF